jgi:hypothetical protein
MSKATSISAIGTETAIPAEKSTGSALAGKPSRTRAPASVWVGRVLSALVVTFLLLASAFPKIFLPELAVAAMDHLGWDARHLPLLATVEVAGALLYAVPRTAPVGALLLTGLFGGAIATHLRVGDPWLSHTLFPLYLGLLTWGGLWLRSPALRALLSGSRGK